MNLGDLKGMVRTYLNEPASVTDKFWTDAEIVQFINVGVRVVHNKIKTVSRGHFTTRATFSTVSGTEYYGLPANLKDLKMLTYQAADGSEKYIHRHEGPNPFVWAQGLRVGTTTNLSGSQDGPSAYWVVGNQLRILPIPGSAMTLRMYYEARITSLVNESDVPSFDEDYHDLAAKWAAIELKPKNQDGTEELASTFEKRESDMVQDLFHRLPSPYSMTKAYLQGI